MSSGPDLFVVCKQCGSEVSPYITECPYCGHRLRRRAPELPRVKSRGPAARAVGCACARSGACPRVRAPPSRSPARARALEYLRVDSPPYATIALVAAGCAGWVLVRCGWRGPCRVRHAPARLSFRSHRGPLHGDWWKLFTSQFAYVNGLYAFVALLAVAIFGWLLERRRGPASCSRVFLGGGGDRGAGGERRLLPSRSSAAATARRSRLLAAWAVPDLEDARRGRYYEGDLLGARRSPRCCWRCLTRVPRRAGWRASRARCVGLVLGLGMHRLDSPEL